MMNGNTAEMQSSGPHGLMLFPFKAVTHNPDLDGPLTYEVEVYQGCVRYKRG